jgi:hypothetical protein
MLFEEKLDLTPAFELRFLSKGLLLLHGLGLVGPDRVAEGLRRESAWGLRPLLLARGRRAALRAAEQRGAPDKGLKEAKKGPPPLSGAGGAAAGAFMNVTPS